MAKPYSIYFKKSGDSPTIDSKEEWGIVCKEFPFMLFGDTKEVASKDFHDKDGEEVFIPDELKMKAYDLDVEFAYKGDVNTANVKIKGFLDYLTGRGGTGANLKVYDTYTKIGRQGVYLKTVTKDLFVRKNSDGDVVTFKVKFRVTDPTTDIVLSV